MDHRALLRDNAVKFMREKGNLQNFHKIAENHSVNCWRARTPMSPLVLDLEIDLVHLYAISQSLYEKVVANPAEGRQIFQEATSGSVRNYLLDKQCQPISHVQLLLRCKFFMELEDGNSLFAKTYGCLSYLRRYVLTSLTISCLQWLNISSICTLSRCSDFNCPGHSGKYISMEELTDNVRLDNCDYCSKKCYEDAAGRGVVPKVLAKFMPVMAFNCRDEKAHCTSLTCSITDPLIGELKLGDTYDICGRYDVSVYEIWGLKRTSFFLARDNITPSTLPPSIRKLWTSFGETGPNDPWSLVRNLSLQLGSGVYRKHALMSLKMGLLLSLATLGNDRCSSILCVSPNFDLVVQDVTRYAANCADKNVPVNFPIHANYTRNGKRIWLQTGSLLSAKTGVLNVGDWASLKLAEQNDLILGLEEGYIKKNQPIVNEETEFLSSPLLLKTAVWTHWKCTKFNEQQPAALRNLINLFGIPFLANVTADSIHERLQLILNGGKTSPRQVPIDELIEYLRIVNGLKVSLSEEAVKLMKDYFVASRRVRKDLFPSQSITFITTLAEAHARLSLRTEVSYDDVVAIIYLYEESMCLMYGYSVSTHPPFMKGEINEIGVKMQVFKNWLNSYLTSLVN